EPGARTSHGCARRSRCGRLRAVESDLLPFAHLNLTVADLDRSLDFYRRWFGFDGSPTTYSDGTGVRPQPPGLRPRAAPRPAGRTPAPVVPLRVPPARPRAGAAVARGVDLGRRAAHRAPRRARVRGLQ